MLGVHLYWRHTTSRVNAICTRMRSWVRSPSGPPNIPTELFSKPPLVDSKVPDGFNAILPPIKLITRKPLSPLHLYPKELKTLGDQIRKRRLDLGLMQKEVAKIIGVTKGTVKCWERRKHIPHIRYYSKITKFLGHHPFRTIRARSRHN